MFSNPAKEIVSEKIHGIPEDLPDWLRDMSLYHLMDTRTQKQEKHEVYTQSEAGVG